jgi:hypothetical protein
LAGKLLLALASTVILGSESHRYQDLILLSDVYDDVSQTIHTKSTAVGLMKNALQKICKEPVVAQKKYHPAIYLERPGDKEKPQFA